MPGKEHKAVGWWLRRDVGLLEGVLTRADMGHVHSWWQQAQRVGGIVI